MVECDHKFVGSSICLKCGVSVQALRWGLRTNHREPMYLMLPLGSGPDRERNRQRACWWQAAVQEKHPEWLVLAPRIALSGA